MAGLAANLRILLGPVEDDAMAERIARECLAAHAAGVTAEPAEVEPLLAAEWYDRVRQRGPAEDARRIRTYTPVDQLLEGGVLPGELITVIAGTGIGKTAMGAHLLIGALSQMRAALYVSLEVPGPGMWRRIVGAMHGWTLGETRRRETDDDRELRGTVEMLDKCGFALRDRDAVSVEQLDAEIDDAERRIGRRLDLVIVDHADYLTDATRSSGRAEAELVRDRYVRLKRLAKRRDLVVVGLHQALDEGEWYHSPRSRSSRGPLECSDLAIGLLRDRESDATTLYLELLKSRRSPLLITAMEFRGSTSAIAELAEADVLGAVDELANVRSPRRGRR